MGRQNERDGTSEGMHIGFFSCGRKTLIGSGIHSSPGLKTFGETGKKAASRPARNALWGLHGEDH